MIDTISKTATVSPHKRIRHPRTIVSPHDQHVSAAARLTDVQPHFARPPTDTVDDILSPRGLKTRNTDAKRL